MTPKQERKKRKLANFNSKELFTAEFLILLDVNSLSSSGGLSKFPKLLSLLTVESADLKFPKESIEFSNRRRLMPNLGVDESEDR